MAPPCRSNAPPNSVDAFARRCGAVIETRLSVMPVRSRVLWHGGRIAPSYVLFLVWGAAFFQRTILRVLRGAL
jgi:hypothetical protein